jgi:hypothetical protein
MNSEQSWEELKQIWTDQLVTVDTTQPQLQRFHQLTGRVVTVNASRSCIVDFQDGGWYDIAPQFLQRYPDQKEAASRYQSLKNSAQPMPHRQG